MSQRPGAFLALAILTLLLLAACSSAAPTQATLPAAPAIPATPTTAAQDARPASATPASAPAPGSIAQPSKNITPISGNLAVEVVAANLDTPWAIDFAPDGRIFVTERPGRIRVIQDGQLLPEPWLVLDVTEVSEAGLLGLALDPQFDQNRNVYVAHTYRTSSGNAGNRLVRLKDDPARNRGTLDRVLLDGVAGAPNHDGGRVKFGPDGKLYWTMGDAQNSSLAQDPASPNGKILRLNPDGSIPGDNPFSNSPVWSLGHRNPEGLAWQPGTGRLYATEHGPSARDEVNLIEPGKNYGWPVITGDETREGMESPVVHSGNSTWAPASATFVTQGPWAGSFLYTGLRGQALFRLVFDSNDPRRVVSSEQLLQGQFGRLRDVVQGPDGQIYITTSNNDGRGSPAPDDDKVLRLIVQ